MVKASKGILILAAFLTGFFAYSWMASSDENTVDRADGFEQDQELVRQIACKPVVANGHDYSEKQPITGHLASSQSVINVAHEIVLDGRFEILTKVALSPDRPGRIKRTDLLPGRRVSEGELVVELESREEQLKVAGLRAEVRGLELASENIAPIEKAKTQFAAANARYRELESIPADLTPPAIEIVEAKSERDGFNYDIENESTLRSKALADLHAKIAELKQAELNLEYSYIKAPVTGVVFQQYKHEGEHLAAEDVIAEIYHLEELSLVFFVDQSTAKNLSSKQFMLEVETGTSALENWKKVSFSDIRISPRKDVDKRFAALMTVPNHAIDSGINGWEFSPGQSVKVRLTYQEPPQNSSAD